jgi:hypothetical protein
MLKKLTHSLLSDGPNSLASFDAIVAARTHTRGGVHRAEDFSGVLATARVEPVDYPPAHALLGQEPTWEQLSDGPRYREAGLAAVSAPRVCLFDDAGVISPDGIVYCRRSRQAVAETVRQWTAPAAEHLIFSAPGYPSAVKLPGRTLSLLTLSGEGFYHLLLEAVPRLHLARPWLESFDRVLVNGTAGGFHERWWRHACLDPAKLVWMSGLCHVACEQLVFVEYPMADQRPGVWLVSAIRESLLTTVPLLRPGRKLWISRTDAKVRQFAWENELLAQLPGVERVELSRLSPPEQIALAREASAILGPHGAGLGHIVFSQPGTKLVELFPSAHRQPIYHRLTALAGGRYAWATVNFAQPDRAAELADRIQRFLDA